MEDDTIKLLRECSAGTKMGITSLNEVMEHVKDTELKKILMKSRETHEKLEERSGAFLRQYQEEEKEPAATAKMMSWMKTNYKFGAEDSDRVAAELITDGCNMGVKSLYRYLHQYPAAGEKAKKLTEDLIKEEDELLHDLREYL